MVGLLEGIDAGTVKLAEVAAATAYIDASQTLGDMASRGCSIEEIRSALCDKAEEMQRGS